MPQSVQPNYRAHDLCPLCTHAFEPTSPRAPRTCGSPALRGESFCYYHHPERKVTPNREAYRARCRERRMARHSFDVPPPTNRRDLLHSLNQIIGLIAANQIDLRRANLLILALQIAGKTLTE